eukprot:820008-Pyramimonas_sp.AAC.2
MGGSQGKDSALRSTMHALQGLVDEALAGREEPARDEMLEALRDGKLVFPAVSAPMSLNDLADRKTTLCNSSALAK